MKNFITLLNLLVLSNIAHAALVVDQTGNDPTPSGYFPVMVLESLPGEQEYSVRHMGSEWMPLPFNQFFLWGDQSLNLESFTFDLREGNYWTNHEVALEYWLGEPEVVIDALETSLIDGEPFQRFIYNSGTREVWKPVQSTPEPSTLMLGLLGMALVARRYKCGI